MTSLESFVNRLNKIGIKIELIGNYPWIYLDKINGVKVTGTYLGNHGFTVFFYSIPVRDPPKITDISVIFKKIREILNK